MTESKKWDNQLNSHIQSRLKLSRVCRRMLYVQAISTIFLEHLRDFCRFDYVMRQYDVSYACYWMCSQTNSDTGRGKKKNSRKELHQFDYIMRKICEERCMQVKLSCECWRPKLILEKKVPEYWIQTRALGDEFEKESRYLPGMSVPIQGSGREIRTSHRWPSTCLQRLDIQRELGWGSIELLVALGRLCIQREPRPKFVGGGVRLTAHPKKIEMKSRRIPRWSV